jgi:hypothetical protein
MRIRDFIKDNRKLIDDYLKDRYNNRAIVLNDKERYEWILNDETLYKFARKVGVKI